MTKLPPHEVRRLEAVAPSEADLNRLIEARRAGAPLQYLEGSAAFGPFELFVDHRVLIPRPETEQLWELVSEVLIARPSVVLDMCTGSGALAFSMARSFPGARVIGVDISAEALEVAAINRQRLGLSVDLVESDLFDQLADELVGAIDLIIANPPYVANREWDGLPEDVRAEPRVALVAGEEGTEVLDRLIESAPLWLAPGGMIACEIGETQARHVRATMERNLAWTRIEVDLAGRPRFALAGKG